MIINEIKKYFPLGFQDMPENDVIRYLFGSRQGDNKNFRIPFSKLASDLGIVSLGGAPITFDGNELPSLNNTDEPVKKGDWTILLGGNYTNINGGPDLVVDEDEIVIGAINDSNQWYVSKRSKISKDNLIKNLYYFISNLERDTLGLLSKEDIQDLTPNILDNQWFNVDSGSLTSNSNYRTLEVLKSQVMDYDSMSRGYDVLHINTTISGVIWAACVLDESGKILKIYEYAGDSVGIKDFYLSMPKKWFKIYVNCSKSASSYFIKQTRINTSVDDIKPVNVKMRDVSSMIGEPFVIDNHFIALTTPADLQVRGNIYKNNQWQMAIVKLTNSKKIEVQNGVCQFYCFYSSGEINSSNFLEYSLDGTQKAGAKYAALLFRKTSNPNGLNNLKIIQDATLLKANNVLRKDLSTIIEKSSETLGKFIGANGVETSNVNYFYNRFNSLDLSKDYFASSGVGGSANISYIHYYTSAGGFISSEYPIVTTTEPHKLIRAKLNIPANTGYLIINARNGNQIVLETIEKGDYYDLNQISNDVQSLKSNLSKKMRVVIEVSSFYVRTRYNENEDLINEYQYDQGNKNITPNSVYKGLKSMTDDEIFSSSPVYHNTWDSTGPIWMPEYWYLFAQHGYLCPVFTANAHGKTSADIGSVWVDNLGRRYKLGSYTTNTITFLPEITEQSPLGNDVRSWKTSGSSTGVNQLTHVSGATNTGAITVTSATTTQIKPIQETVQRIFNVDGKSVGLGEYDCDTFSASSLMKGIDPKTVTNWFPVTGGDPLVYITESFNFYDKGCLVNTILDVRKPLKFSAYGANQARNLQKVGTFDAYWMIPKIKPLNIWGGTFDLSIPFLANDTTRGSVPVLRNTDTLIDVNDQPDRTISFLKDSSDNFALGFASGYSLINGVTQKDQRNDLIPIGSQSIYLSPSAGNKFYPYSLIKEKYGVLPSPYQAGAILPSSTIVEINYYFVYFEPKSNEQVYWYKDGSDFIAVIHLQQSKNREMIYISPEFEGKKIEVIEKTSGLTLISSKIQNASVMLSADSSSNYIVLKCN